MRLVEVVLGGPTAYEDYPPIPERLGCSFKLWVLDDDEGGGFRHHDRVQEPGEPDIVSRDIVNNGVWEVPETILLSSAFAASPKDTLFVDVGAHVGWFSAVAASWGLDVWAIDSNPTALAALTATWKRNQFGSLLLTTQRTVDADIAWSHPERDRVIVKMDIEGNERFAVDALWPWFEHHIISHCLMEVSPCFNDTYPALLGRLFDAGYRGHVMPRKAQQPKQVNDIPTFLSHWCRRLDHLPRQQMADWTQRQHQYDIILFAPGAAWG